MREQANRPAASPAQTDSFMYLLYAINGAADRLRERMRDGLAGEHGVERIAQVGLGGLRTLLAEILDAVIDAAEVEHFPVGREHRGLRDDGGVRELDEHPARGSSRSGNV